MEDQAVLKRQYSSPHINQIQEHGTDVAMYFGHESPLKRQQSRVSGSMSPRAEGNILPLKNRAQEVDPHKTEPIHERIKSKIALNEVAPVLSAKAELRMVDELKARREGVLRAIEQQCEDDCRGGMKPCSIMLRLEIMHGGFPRSWVK